MKLRLPAILLAIFLFSTFCLTAQDIPVRPKTIKTGTFIGISKPLRDIPAISKEDYLLMEAKAKKRGKNTPWDVPTYPFASSSLPKGPDAAWQKTGGKASMPKAPIVNFEGQTSPYYPPDCNGATGPNHYMQTVNTTYAIYNKSGTIVAGPTNMNLLFGSVTGATYNDGDPVILYDEQADRWFATEFSITGANDYMLFAVSTTNDPTGTWYQYSFDVVDMPDYEKVAVWRDGYYMGTNTQPTTGNDIYVFERSQMLIGGTARMVAFDNPYRPGTGVVVVPPVDNDGPAAPAGTPGQFIAFNDDAVGGGADELWIYELKVDWVTLAYSTFNRTQQLPVMAFDTQFNSWEDITQPGTTRKLCAISTVIMNVPQYRNFGTYQSIVCCHTVDVDNTDHAGVRWYELRKTPPATTWTIRQTGTYAPDIHSRWMGAISMNGSNKIALGYSISSSTVYPGIRYTGQSASGYASASGVLDVPEETALTGTNFQTTYNRWGDYASMCVDPSDDQTFWFTTEYIGASEARKTKIISFKIGNNPIVATLAATAVTGTSATINGTVNPNGLATTYYFQWGTTVSYGNTTTSTSAGSGSAAVAVSANLTSLVGGTTYHFRLVAVNSDGTTNGVDFTFIPGGAAVTTTAASSIGLTTASSGGTVTADGGSPVTARGVCWATTANPVATGNHTTDGSGTGVFTSSITGLTSSTLYHVRAYATNANGTFYGEDLTFTTTCGIYTLPFTESFSGTSIPTCWTQLDNQGNGQIWQFGAITTGSPNPALTGNYAYLNSDAYGSGNSQNADLISPTLNLAGYSAVNLAFSHYFLAYAGSSGKLSYSIDNGSTWTLITTITATTANPASFSQAVAAVVGQPTVKFKWNYTGSYGYYWGVDNINITGTVSSPPIVTTTAATSVATTTATSGGNVTSIGGSSVTARGVCWSTTANPDITASHTTDGSGIGVFTSSITGLTVATLYHVRAYATNTGGTAYGSDLQFTTLASLPTLTTTAASSIAATTASSGGTVTADGGATVTAKGVCWSTTANPDITTSHTSDGTGIGVFTSSITGLTAVTLYHVRAYATNSVGTAYGSDLQFTTLATLPTVTTTTPTSIAATTASSGGNVTAIGGSAVSARGVCWSTTANPDITASHTTDGSGSGVFTSSITGLTPGTLYHVRAYATNTGGTAYGSDLQFTTLTALPTVTTTTPTSILSTTASSGGNVTADGGATVTARGVCWATTASPVATGNHTTDGTDIGAFTSSITGLTANTPYHVRAYATNSVGTAYGSDLQFTTLALPTLGVTPSNQNVTAVAGTTSFAVTSNSSWTAGSNQGWCTVTLSGTGNGTITANYTENTSVTPRVANVTVTVAGLTPVVVTVSQAGVTPTLIVTPPDQPVTSAAGSTSFSVTSNTGWTAGSNQSWCTVTLSGTGNGTITANYTENTTFVVRVANVTVTVTGLTPVVVTVTQAAAALPEFLFTIENDIQTSDRTMEFDLYLFNTNASTPFELATVQAGVLVNPGIYGGGTITLSIVANSSELVAASRPTNVLWVQSQNIIKLVPKTPPGAGSGTILSATAPGTRVCRLRITNTLPFTASSIANLSFNFPTIPYPTKVFKYVGITNVQLTCNAVNCYSNAINALLNAPATLAVTPSNQGVTVDAGSTPFGVISNASWTATSDQVWCTVTPSGYGNGTITAAYTANTSVTPRVANVTVTVTGLAPVVVTVTQAGIPNKILNLSVLLEGLYSGGGTMNAAADEYGAHWGPTIADKITVELHNNSNYADVLYTQSNVNLSTNGVASLSLPSAYSGSYYITIKHRNSIETVSALPVSFTGSTISYAFDNASKAFGSNMLLMIDGGWVIYGGDVNQDGIIDSGDMAPVENMAAAAASGYVVEDANGDGLVDSGDMAILDNNSAMAVSIAVP